MDNCSRKIEIPWLSVFDADELREMIVKLLQSDNIDATVHEWHESALALMNPELEAASAENRLRSWDSICEEVLLTDPEFKAEYEALVPEYSEYRALLDACENPPEPGERLKAAAKRHKEKLEGVADENRHPNLWDLDEQARWDKLNEDADRLHAQSILNHEKIQQLKQEVIDYVSRCEADRRSRQSDRLDAKIAALTIKIDRILESLTGLTDDNEDED